LAAAASELDSVGESEPADAPRKEDTPVTGAVLMVSFPDEVSEVEELPGQTAAPSDPHELFASPDAFAAPDTFGPPDPFDAMGPLGGVEPPPADALFAAAAPVVEARIEAPELPELPGLAELPDLGAVAAEPEPIDFLPADHDLSDAHPDLPLAAGLGAEHGPDLLPVIEPPAPGHVSPDVPLQADDQALDDTEFDLTGALNALAKNGVSISDALDAVLPPPAAVGGGGGQADQKSGGLPAGAAALTPAGVGAAAGTGAGTGAPGKDAAHGNGAAGDEVDLEQVFDGLRNQAAGDMVEMAQPDQSLRLLSMADTYQAAGMFDEARAALEQVASDSRHRFRAAASLGRLFWQQGDADASLRWMELASEAPAPDPEAGRALMYELGEKLEQTGETTRALAVFLELLGEQEGYRDVQQRVDRLSRVQAG
jgi:hypothetical protein